MFYLRTLMTISLLSAFATSCGKKDSDDNSGGGDSKPAGVLEAYSEVSSSAGKLNLTQYKSGTSLALADEEWDDSDWATTDRFNCFGECDGSITAKQYVDDAINPKKPGPLGTAMESIEMLCIVGALYADDLEDGLPPVGTKKFKITKDIIKVLEDECDAGDDVSEGLQSATLSAKTTDVSGDDYDRKIVFTVDGDNGEEEYPFYYKNSDDIVAIGTFEKSGDESEGSITRSVFKIDMAKKIFRMEYYSRDWPTDHENIDDHGFSFYRGFLDEDSGEVRFLSNMGNSNYQLNNTFLSLNGNEGDSEKQAGAYFARTSQEGTGLEGAFVCFKKKDGDYVNNSGCTENDDEDRKTPWSKDESLWKKVEAKEFDDLSDKPGTLPDFNADTMFTAAPEFK